MRGSVACEVFNHHFIGAILQEWDLAASSRAIWPVHQLRVEYEREHSPSAHQACAHFQVRTHSACATIVFVQNTTD